jgi:hypothetical protein
MKVANIRLEWKGPMPQEVSQAILDVIREDTKRGIGFNGASPVQFPSGVDLRETGNLMDTAKAYAGGKIIWSMPYAKAVNDRFPFAIGLSDSQKKRVLIKVGHLIKANVTHRSV